MRPTKTATVLVCSLPFASVAGTRCTRCTPLSKRNLSYAPSPFISNIASLLPPPAPAEGSLGEKLTSSMVNPVSCARREYIRKSSERNSVLSSPPTPALNSINAEKCAVCDGGTNAEGKFASCSARRWDNSAYSSCARDRRSGSGSESREDVWFKSYWIEWVCEVRST